MNDYPIVSISGKKGSGKDTVANIISYLDVYKDSAADSSMSEIVNTFHQDNTKTCWTKIGLADKVKQVAGIITDMPANAFEHQDVKKARMPSKWAMDVIYDIDTEQVVGRYTDREEAKLELDRYNAGLNWGEKSPFDIKYDYVPTYREFLQWLGTDAGRKMLHPNVWVYATFDDPDYHRPLIIKDTRFINELTEIHKRGGICIKIERFVGRDVYHNSRPFHVYSIDENDICHLEDDFGLKDTMHVDELRRLINQNEHVSETEMDKYENYDYIIYNEGTLKELYLSVKHIYDKKIQYMK